MGRSHGLVSGWRWVTAGVTVALAYAVLVSFTRPFTWAADAVTAVPVGLAAVVTIWTSRNPGPSGTDTVVGVDPGAPHRLSRWWALWTAPILASIGWELYCLVNLPRAQHPTLSALIDMLDDTRPGKVVAVVSWLALGSFLVTR